MEEDRYFRFRSLCFACKVEHDLTLLTPSHELHACLAEHLPDLHHTSREYLKGNRQNQESDKIYRAFSEKGLEAERQGHFRERGDR